MSSQKAKWNRGMVFGGNFEMKSKDDQYDLVSIRPECRQNQFVRRPRRCFENFEIRQHVDKNVCGRNPAISSF